MTRSFDRKFLSLGTIARTMLLWALLVCWAASMQSCFGDSIEGEGMGRFETQEATVTAMSSGEVTQLNVAEGQLVDRGMVVGMIENTQLLMQRNQLHSSLQEIEANRMMAAHHESSKQQLEDLKNQAASLRQQIADVQNEKAHYEEMYENGIVSREQVEGFDIRLDVLMRQLGVLDEQIANTVLPEEEGHYMSHEDAELRANELEAQISQIDQQLTSIQITCPIKGTITQTFAKMGDYVEPGKELFKLADLSKMTLRVYVSESFLDQLKLGSKVRVAAETGEGNPAIYDGIVMWVSANAEFASNKPSAQGNPEGGMHAVKIEVENDGRISIGTKGRVLLEE